MLHNCNCFCVAIKQLELEHFYCAFLYNKPPLESESKSAHSLMQRHVRCILRSSQYNFLIFLVESKGGSNLLHLALVDQTVNPKVMCSFQLMSVPNCTVW